MKSDSAYKSIAKQFKKVGDDGKITIYGTKFDTVYMWLNDHTEWGGESNEGPCEISFFRKKSGGQYSVMLHLEGNEYGGQGYRRIQLWDLDKDRKPEFLLMAGFGVAATQSFYSVKNGALVKIVDFRQFEEGEPTVYDMKRVTENIIVK